MTTAAGLPRAEAHRQILRWRRLAAKLAAKLAARCDADRRDNFQAAMLGLCEAAQTFEPGRGNTFQTHGIWGVRGQLTRAARDRRRGGVVNAPVRFYRFSVPMTDLHRDEKLQARAHHPAVTDPEPDESAAFWRLVRKHAVCRFDYLLVRAVYFHGLRQADVADAIGLSRTRVKKRVQRTMRRLRERAAEFEGFR